MGMAGARFGRNIPLDHAYGEGDERLLKPSPREVSRHLLTRHEFIPVKSLNQLAAAWIQFMVHDWFSHGPSASPKDVEPIEVPLAQDDPWPQDPMVLPRTRVDGSAGKGGPAAFTNTETHWWDASQLYGSSRERLSLVRTDPTTGQAVPDGKLYLDAAGHLPRQPHTRNFDGETGEVELSGVNGNWWIGLSLLHTLFAREHNAVCDRLRIDYPDKDGDWLFDKARLVIAALLAKIHTVEWTPALLNNPTMRFAMRGNWWGALGETYKKAYGRVSDGDLLSGIVGGQTNHHGVSYSLTEEFVAVYRMHSFVPDAFDFRSHVDDSTIDHVPLPSAAGMSTHQVYDKVSFVDALYSLGTAHPGALRLNNFPRHLQELTRQNSGRLADLAAVDVLRDRERGVPRYCEFRRLLHMRVPSTFEDLTGGDRDAARALASVYDHVEDVDMMIGCLAEPLPEGFGFSDTAFRVFILMASRRLKSDRFYTKDFRAEVYTQAGMDWIEANGMASVLRRRAPALAPHLDGVRNPFFPWHRSDD